MPELTLKHYSIPLTKAMWCSNCDEIHAGWECPKCGEGPSYHLTNWIKPVYQEDIRRENRGA